MQRDPIDVLIVGAGPTGLTLAVQLALLGVRIRIIDRSADRVHESRALALQPRSLEVLAGLGVTDGLVAAGNRAVQVKLHLRDRVLSVPLFDLGLEDTEYPYLLFLSQAETERLLEERLAGLGITVERQVELTDLTQDAGSVTAVLRHAGTGPAADETVRAAYAVGCDGARSAVRRIAGIPFKGSTYPQTFLLADAEADGLERGAAHAFASAKGILLFFPLGSPATWRLLAIKRTTAARPPGAPEATLDEVQAAVDDYTGGTVRLHDAAWITEFRIHLRAAARYRSGRLFLAGDAAHVHSPAGAQGMNTGIQDAVNLGWKLAQALAGTGGPNLLDTYQAERQPVGKAVLRLSNRPFRIATSLNPLVRFARSRVSPVVAPLAAKATWGRARLFRTISELGIGYRRSALSVNGPGPRVNWRQVRWGRVKSRHSGLRAGDRLPDTPVVYEGETTTLHRVLAGPAWHLLHWRLPDGGAAHYLVRPDGYIGYCYMGDNDEGAAGLAEYLNRWVG
ncbi:FAD-dependent monooxygenase [Pseudarthrobacter sp. NPDC058362]|uniref:FAD-dependent monooxygenase n=1 Tax=Pseudarthrobacter sp. NPDC058362 TaxID=3346458 RepID=UPI00364A8BA1